MNNYKVIEIAFKDGHSATWEADRGEWDDYAYDGKVFIVKKDGFWVGIYNIDCIRSIVVE